MDQIEPKNLFESKKNQLFKNSVKNSFSLKDQFK